MAAAEIPSLDEIPALAVAAAVAEGTTVFSDVGELRVKEVDRLQAVIDMVTAFGATAEADGDTLSITGTGGPGRPACTGPVSTAWATTAWPWPPPWPPWPPRRASAASSPGSAPSRPATRGSPTTCAASPGPDPRAPRGPAHRHRRPGRGRESRRSRAAVAARLGLDRLDTGAMYRAVAALALARGIAPDDHDAVAALAAGRRRSRSAPGSSSTAMM